MTYYICEQCGVQYADSDQPPERCQICDEERQYINPNGQRWTTLEQLREGYHNVFTEVEPNLVSIRTEPSFAIGQTAHLIQTKEGNILWDCITLIDDKTIKTINELGGLKAIAISHPHFYSTCVEWGQAFGEIPVYLHRLDKRWVMRPDSVISHWGVGKINERLEVTKKVMLIVCGGHFPGSCVLHWRTGPNREAVLLTGDTIFPAVDPNRVSFMYSYPNLIPLNAAAIRDIISSLREFEFDRLYGAFGRRIEKDAKQIVKRSADHYIRRISRRV